MSNLYNKIVELCESRDITGYRLCKDIHARPSMLTDLKMGRKEALASDTLSKIANYFNVSVDYLLGTEKKPATQEDDELSKLHDEAIRKLNYLKQNRPDLYQIALDHLDVLLKNKENRGK